MSTEKQIPRRMRFTPHLPGLLWRESLEIVDLLLNIAQSVLLQNDYCKSLEVVVLLQNLKNKRNRLNIPCGEIELTQDCCVHEELLQLNYYSPWYIYSAKKKTPEKKISKMKNRKQNKRQLNLCCAFSFSIRSNCKLIFYFRFRQWCFQCSNTRMRNFVNFTT